VAIAYSLNWRPWHVPVSKKRHDACGRAFGAALRFSCAKAADQPMLRSFHCQPRHRLELNMDSTLQQDARPSLQWKRGVMLCSLPCIVFMSAFPMTSHATEEPEYKIVRNLGDIEVREYAAYTVAEVGVAGPAEEAGSQAFPILAAYIFGKNKGERKFAMTAPVTQSAASVKLKMTAPVMQKAAPVGFLVQFVLPKGVTLVDAPVPLDQQVTLREVAPSRVAVIRYSGFWSQANYSEHLTQLQDALKAANLAASGEPVYARYNAPFTPWFMRRNEIWLPLADAR
jgi:hypothetical protein